MSQLIKHGARTVRSRATAAGPVTSTGRMTLDGTPQVRM